MYQKFLKMSAKPWPGPSATFAIHLKVKSKKLKTLKTLKTDDIGLTRGEEWDMNL